MSRRFFIPLKSVHYEAFCAGLKTEEFRRADTHFGGAKVGDRVTLSCGYGKKRRRSGEIISVRFTSDVQALAGWVECYGATRDRAVCLGIRLDAKGVS